MFEVFYPSKDEFGNALWVKVCTPRFFKKLETAIKKCNKLGKYAYVHQYGKARAVYSSFTGELHV